MDETLKRIICLMKEKSISDIEMQEYLGIPKGTFSNWKRLKGKSYYQHIDKISEKLGVSINFLVRGEDLLGFELTEEEKELLVNYRLLAEDGKKIVFDSARLLPHFDENKKIAINNV